MIAILLSPLYIAVNVYILKWLLKWMRNLHNGFCGRWVMGSIIVLYIFFASAIAVAFLLPQGTLQRMIKHIGNYWMGVMLYVILTVAVMDIIRLILRHIGKIGREKPVSRRVSALSGAVCIAVIGAFSISGIINAGIIHTEKYEIGIAKNVSEIKKMKIVMAADMHMGYSVGCKQIRHMVKKINEEDADLVVFAGDIFDNEYEALDNPEELIKILGSIESRYGVYACYGNHDIEEKLLMGFSFKSKSGKKASDIRMDDFLKKAGIKLLRDEGVLIDEKFYIYGRADMERPGRGINVRKSPKEITQSMDKSKPIFVADHEPDELKELAKAGVDLDMCGHTHDGQVFPGNLTINLFWENPYGYMKTGNMHNIVTSGVGVYGPAMRVGTKAEICSITVRFK